MGFHGDLMRFNGIEWDLMDLMVTYWDLMGI